MFPRLPARATFVADTKNVSDFVQKHFVSAANVSQFAQPKKHHGQQCVLVYQCLNTTLSPGFLRQLFNNLRRAALLTSSVQWFLAGCTFDVIGSIFGQQQLVNIHFHQKYIHFHRHFLSLFFIIVTFKFCMHVWWRWNSSLRCTLRSRSKNFKLQICETETDFLVAKVQVDFLRFKLFLSVPHCY